MRFHLTPLSLRLCLVRTWRGQIEVMHISEGCNLKTLTDTAKLNINDGKEVIYALSFGTVNLECPEEVESRSCIFNSYPFCLITPVRPVYSDCRCEALEHDRPKSCQPKT